MCIFFTGRNVVNTKDLSEARIKSLNALDQILWEKEVERELSARVLLGKHLWRKWQEKQNRWESAEQWRRKIRKEEWVSSISDCKQLSESFTQVDCRIFEPKLHQNHFTYGRTGCFLVISWEQPIGSEMIGKTLHLEWNVFWLSRGG